MELPLPQRKENTKERRTYETHERKEGKKRGDPAIRNGHQKSERTLLHESWRKEKGERKKFHP